MIYHKNPQEAIKRIRELNEDDLKSLEAQTLFDTAVQSRYLDVANAMIGQYAKVTNNPGLEPLAIDYDQMANNTKLYNESKIPFVTPGSLVQYKFIVEEQKDKYLDEIKEETKKLRIMGVEKLLDVTSDPEKRQALADALAAYKEDTSSLSDNYSLTRTSLQTAIDAAANSVSEDDKKSTTYEKAKAAIDTANDLDLDCEVFRMNRGHGAHPSLESFQQKLNSRLNHESNKILKESPGFGETMAAIGNAISRYTGIGYVIAATQGKFQEFHELKWKLFNDKTDYETQQEHIGSKINFRPGG